MNPVFARLWAAAERSGASFLAADKDQILGAADGIADAWLDQVVTAICDNLPAGGLKSFEWGPIRNAVLASEPQIDQATNDRISALFDAIESAVGNAPSA